MKLKNRYMKKMLLNLLVIMLSLFCITACGKIKKDPEVVKYITDKINQDINKAIPKDKLEIDSYKESISKTLKKREAQLAKNIKIEVTDVISSKEYIDMYVKELEERNQRLKEQGGILVKLIF